MNNKILLTFDVEEFDIPEEFGGKVSDEQKMGVSSAGLKKVLLLLEKLKIRATFFTTAHFALSKPEWIKILASRHEVASHGVEHSSFETNHIRKSKEVLEKLTGTGIKGFRMPRMKKIKASELADAGYTYDSSRNPTYIPGRYNGLFDKRTCYYDGGLLIIPASVVPIVRFPLFWLSFKNFPMPFIRLMSSITLSTDSYLCLYFHPWEFEDISAFPVPDYVKRITGDALLLRLERYLLWLKERGEFITMHKFTEERAKEKMGLI